MAASSFLLSAPLSFFFSPPSRSPFSLPPLLLLPPHHHHHPPSRLTTSFSSSSFPPHSPSPPKQEHVFFDGGPHYGDLLSNLIFGLSLLWLPLTLASVFRALFLRYRFTNLRVTVISGLTAGDRKDFSYSVIKDVQFVPRFVGAWGDVVITLTDDTKVDLKCVPKFREITKYCLEKAKDEPKSAAPTSASGPKGFSS